MGKHSKTSSSKKPYAPHSGTMMEQPCPNCATPLAEEQVVNAFYSLGRQTKCTKCGTKSRVKTPIFMGLNAA